MHTEILRGAAAYERAVVNVCRDHGVLCVPSGVTYYREVVVSGTLSPDATGTYTAAGMYNGVPYYRRTDGAYYIWCYLPSVRWQLTVALGLLGSGRFQAGVAPAPYTGDYVGGAGWSGSTATVTATVASGVYLFVQTSTTGAAIWPLQDDAPTVGRTGGIVDVFGRVPGAASGVTYYQQVTVSGTLSPDATGTYTAAGMYNGSPYYVLGVWKVWYSAAGTRWYLSQALGNTGSPGAWYTAFGVVVIASSYAPRDGATGTATVAPVTASGIYRFDASGLTFGNTGPVIAGEVVRAVGFDGVGGYASAAGSVVSMTESTVSFWVNSIAFGAVATVFFANRSSVSNGIVIWRLAAGAKIGVGWGASGATPRWTTNYDLSTGVWTLITVTRDASGLRLYVNGALQDSRVDPGTTTPGAAALFFGRDSSAAQYYLNGSLALPTIIPAALSAGEVKYIMDVCVGNVMLER